MIQVISVSTGENISLDYFIYGKKRLRIEKLERWNILDLLPNRRGLRKVFRIMYEAGTRPYIKNGYMCPTCFERLVQTKKVDIIGNKKGFTYLCGHCGKEYMVLIPIQK